MQDREQYIKRLEANDRSSRMEHAIMSGVVWGGFMTFLAYDGFMEIIGRPDDPEALLVGLIGLVVGPTVAFIREKRKQQQEIKNIDLADHSQ